MRRWMAFPLALSLTSMAAPAAGDDEKRHDAERKEGERPKDVAAEMEEDLALIEAARKVGVRPAGAVGEMDEDLALLEEEHVHMVVSVSKHGQKLAEAPAAVTIISSEDIAASGAQTIADLFRRVPGLDFFQVSARDYEINARGFNNTLSRRLLVLVDGRSVYMELLGFTPWDLIQVPLSDIERIEVVRGPGSALYGANATSGVVNIITKSPRDIDGGEVRAGYGELGTIDASVSAGRAPGRLGFKVAAGFFDTEPYDNPDRDGDSAHQRDGGSATQQARGTFRIQYDLDDDSRWLGEAGYAETSGILYTQLGPLDIQDGSNTPYFRTSYSRGNFYVQGYWNRLDGDTLNLTSLQRNFFETDTYDVEAQYNMRAGARHLLVFGGNVRYNTLDSDLASEAAADLNAGVYVQDEIRLGDEVTATVAVRVDHDELIGTTFAPKAAVVYAPSERHALRLSVATAYNSGSFMENYLDFVFKLPLGGGATLDITAQGNTELDPERITSYEIGYRAYPVPELLLDVNVFYARLTDFVQFVPIAYYAPDIPSTYGFVNAGEATETGLELAAEYFPTEHLSFFASYAYTDTNQDREVVDVFARNKASVGVQYARTRGFCGGLSMSYADSLTFADNFPFYEAGETPSYTVWNGAASWRFLSEGQLSVGIRGTNLLDREHREFIAGDVISRKVLAEIGYRF